MNDRILLQVFIDYILPVVMASLVVVIAWGMFTEGGTVDPFKKE